MVTNSWQENNFHDRIRQRDPRVTDTSSPLYPHREQKRTKQWSVKALMLFMTKTRYIKTFATASEACVSHVVADAHFRLCHLVCTVEGPPRTPETCSRFVQCFVTPTWFRKANSATWDKNLHLKQLTENHWHLIIHRITQTGYLNGEGPCSRSTRWKSPGGQKQTWNSNKTCISV